MPSLTIRHVTVYRYRQPVGFGEHRMMLRPRDSHDQRVIDASLEISPEPASLRFLQDAFGNHVGIARFSGRSKELRFERQMRPGGRVDPSPFSLSSPGEREGLRRPRSQLPRVPRRAPHALSILFSSGIRQMNFEPAQMVPASGCRSKSSTWRTPKMH
jgi:transglutaminase-like putative cysteine protease